VTDASQRSSEVAAERDEGRPADVTDATLFRAVQDRRVGALDALYGRFGRPAYSLARRICVDEGLAEDVVQEVFLAIWREPERFDPARGSVSSWLLTLVHHRAVDAVRREAGRRRHTVAPSEDGEEWSGPPGPGADVGAIDAVVAGHVRDALAQLPAEQREALALAYYGGYTQREVASLVKVPLGTVKSRMFTAVKRMRVLLEPHVDESGGKR
jgi:RNA polymerase sigma factor (sigma-70 family)